MARFGLRDQLSLSKSACPLKERLRFRITFLFNIKLRQIVQVFRNPRIVLPQRFFRDFQSAAIKGLGFGVVSLGGIERRQIVHQGRQFGRIGTRFLFCDFQGAAVKRFRFAIPV